MLLHLSCKGYGIGLDLPATPDVAADRLSKLREGHRPTTPVQISGVGDPFSTLYPYIQNADLENEIDLQKLNAIAEQVNSMTQEEQRLFSGALELECTGGLDDALHIAEDLEWYEIFPKIKTDTDLGRFLVDTAVVTGKFSFPESARPYLDTPRSARNSGTPLAGCTHRMVWSNAERKPLCRRKHPEQCF